MKMMMKMECVCVMYVKERTVHMTLDSDLSPPQVTTSIDDTVGFPMPRHRGQGDPRVTSSEVRGRRWSPW